MNDAKAVLTVDEAVEFLKRSSVPNLVIEGRDDIIVLRAIESLCADIGLQLLAVGGRDAVLRVFARRREIKSKARILFQCDQDLWVMSSVPIEYSYDNFFLTDGYSIENDVIRDGGFDRLMSPQERQVFSDDVARFVEWYALALSRRLRGEPEDISHSPHRVLPPNGPGVLLDRRPNESDPIDLRNELLANCARLLRGKSLLALFLRQLSSMGRQSKYSRFNLLEMGVAARGPLLTDLFNRIAAAAGSASRQAAIQ